MSKWLEIDNPFYDNDASASIFGWDFQINAAIFLFLKYLKDVYSVKVESKHQDIELQMNDKSCIYAQAKSVQDGSNTNNKKKLEDAIISLAKTPVDYAKKDKLLYVSNYSEPIKEKNLYNNKIVSLKDVKDEKEEFEKVVSEIINKLNNKIISDNELSVNSRNKFNKLINRLNKMNTDDFLVCSIVPYLNTEQPDDKYQMISELIKEKLTYNFNITSSNVLRYVKEILKNWQISFLQNATIPDKNKEKLMTKLELMLQIIAIVSENETENLKELLTFELNDDAENQYQVYYSQKGFYHDRFEFINNLYDEYKNFSPVDPLHKKGEFIKNRWDKYKEEYPDFMQYTDVNAQEYLIKRDLLRLLTNSSNIKNIINGVQNDN